MYIHTYYSHWILCTHARTHSAAGGHSQPAAAASLLLSAVTQYSTRLIVAAAVVVGRNNCCSARARVGGDGNTRKAACWRSVGRSVWFFISPVRPARPDADYCLQSRGIADAGVYTDNVINTARLCVRIGCRDYRRGRSNNYRPILPLCASRPGLELYYSYGPDDDVTTPTLLRINWTFYRKPIG